MANPLHTPMQNPMTKKLMELVDPTAARAWAPSSFPTIIVSIKL